MNPEHNPGTSKSGGFLLQSSARLAHVTLLCAFAVLMFSLAASVFARDILIADFESDNFGSWKTTGQAFGSGPAHGALPGQMPVSGFDGRGFASSFHGADASTGTLTSPEFKIERRYLRFLIGGGGWPERTCLNLLVDGRVVRTALGPNTHPGGSEKLEPAGWDVGDFLGQTARLEMVDQEQGGWGHISVDQITLTDTEPATVITDARREILLDQQYLHLPVKNGAPRRQLKFIVNDRSEREFEIELAAGAPDWWAFMDVTPFRGRKAILLINNVDASFTGLDRVEQGSGLKDAEDLYREPLRPQFHFTSRRGWLNDPNGLVYYAGEYHLFYQHNPYGWNWGNMHWGHAVSSDLLHWKELSVALYPDQFGTMFSGSAVVDWNNTAGFQTGAEKALVCMFTAAGKRFTQGLAFSNDRGRTWTKYEKNPVLPEIAAGNRDPKVLWHAPSKKWIMALYLDKSDFALFASPNLKEWQRLCEVSIPGTSECPEFFEIAVDGKAGETRWIFYGAHGGYLIGRFDGQRFISESGPQQMQHGDCWYASQTFNDIPASDGRRVLIPWGQMALPGMPFNQMMGLPVELTLRSTPDGLRLFANPVRELENLRFRSHGLKPQELKPGEKTLAGVTGELLDVCAELEVGSASEIGFNLRGVPVVYDALKQELVCKNKRTALKPIDGRIRLRMLVDRASVDIFANDGRLYMPMGVIVPEDNRALELYANGGTARITEAKVHELRSIWQ